MEVPGPTPVLRAQ